MNISKRGAFLKADDDTAGIAYGWAIVCTEDGADYTDLQGDHIPESVMVDAAVDFALNSRVGKDMHSGDQVGDVFVYPITKGSAVGLGITTTKTGLLIGFKPHDPALLELIKSGARSGFSIGGTLTESDATKSIAKSAASPAAGKRTFRSFKIHEISLVDLPAQEGATVGYVKSAPLVIASVPEAVAIITTNESPRARKSHTVNSQTEKATMDPTQELADLKALKTKLEAKIADLETEAGNLKASVDDLQATAEMTDEEKALAATLTASEQKRFRGLAKSARLAEVAKARENDPVVATIDGIAYRKSTPGSQLAMKLAEQIDKAETGEIEKQATAHLGFLAGDKADHAELIKAVHAHTKGNLEKRAKLLTVLDGANAIAKGRTTAGGFDGSTGGNADASDNAYEALTKGLTKFCAEQKIGKVWSDGLAKFKLTPEGAALNDAHNAALVG
ncbi:MAG: XkdF-like putative serine protease domain-containing protein [Acidobacteriota bacterium]|nr:XkdF-like putative serine protease domain-containing protein [Acidobacteriota bacterium]